MRNFRLMAGRNGIALVATYMLVLQALMGAFAMGAANSAPMLDAFGNPLCITSSGFTASGPDRAEHGALPDCCTVACSMFAPVVADDRMPRSLHNPLEPATRQPVFAFDDTGNAFKLERGQGSPRAPPLLLA